jgi:hypothetical protein
MATCQEASQRKFDGFVFAKDDPIGRLDDIAKCGECRKLLHGVKGSADALAREGIEG